MELLARWTALSPAEWTLVGALVALVMMARRSADGAMTGGFVLLVAPVLINFTLGHAIAQQVSGWLAGLIVTATLVITGRR